MKTRNKVVFRKYSQFILNTNQGHNRSSQNINESSLILTVTTQITQLNIVLFSLIVVVSISLMYVTCTQCAQCVLLHMYSELHMILDTIVVLKKKKKKKFFVWNKQM